MPDSSSSPRICFFGYFDRETARTWILSEGFTQKRYTPLFCHSLRPGFFPKILDLRRQWARTTCDAMIVMFPGQYLMPFAWVLAKIRGVPLVLDAFISQYDTLVRDRRLVSAWSPIAPLLWFLDWLACHLADVVLIDTKSHQEYFVSTFHLSAPKVLVLPVGARYDIFRPASQTTHDRFTVLFHGTFIPLQGIDVILQAAAILQKEAPDLVLRLLGRGQTRPAMEALASHLQLRNVVFAEPVPLPTLAAEIQRADIGLGIFGSSDKAARVVPHKAYDILACGRPLITGDSPAARDLLHDGKTALLTPMGDAPALAAAILRLKNDPALAQRLATSGATLIQEQLQPAAIVAPLIAWLGVRAVHSPS